MTNVRAIFERTQAFVLAALVLCGSSAIVRTTQAFQFTPPLLQPHGASIVRNRIIYRGNVVPTAADVTAGEDFFAPPDGSEDMATTNDEIQKAYKKGSTRKYIKKKFLYPTREMFREQKRKVLYPTREMLREQKRKVLYPTRDMFREQKRKVNEILTGDYSSTSHDNAIDKESIPTISMASTIAPDSIEATQALYSISDTSTSTNNSEDISIDKDNLAAISMASTIASKSIDEAQVVDEILDTSTSTNNSKETMSEIEIPKKDAEWVSSQSTTIEVIAGEDVVKETLPSDSIATAAIAECTTPNGDRWAISALDVDLSGKWELVVTNDFKKHYDKYLERLGQPRLVRSVALSSPVISQTMEEIIQTDCGRSLLIRGKNVRGTWDRTLEASGAALNEDDYTPLKVPIQTVDGEQVESEAWWEEEGTVHTSWMRGVTMYGGGSFFSRRYFEEVGDETLYVCESSFVFNDPKKEDNGLTWKFRRMNSK